MQIPDNCPVQEDTTQITELSKDLTKYMRKLRRDIANCVKCPIYEECPVLSNFNTIIQETIQEINAEWDLTTAIVQEI